MNIWIKLQDLRLISLILWAPIHVLLQTHQVSGFRTFTDKPVAKWLHCICSLWSRLNMNAENNKVRPTYVNTREKEGLDWPPGLQCSEAFAVPFSCPALDCCQAACYCLSFLVFNYSTKRTGCYCFFFFFSFSSVHKKKGHICFSPSLFHRGRSYSCVLELILP